MSINETDKCPICNEFKNSMLQLQCYHDPCLACAALAHTQQKQVKHSSQSKEHYVCTVCGEKTPLERQTVRELEDIARKQEHLLDKPVSVSSKRRSPVKTPIVPRGYIEETSRQNTSRDLSARKAPRNNQDQSSIDLIQQLTRSKSKTARRIKCRTHLEQEVSYYCLDCLENICAECAINGLHRGHRAKTSKKAIPQILKQYDMLMERAEREFESQKRQKHELSKSLNELSEQSATQKGQISKQFQLFRQALQLKEHDLLLQVDELQQRNQALIKNEIEMLIGSMQLATAFIEEVKKTVRMEQLSMLGEFVVKRDFLSANIVKASKRRQPSEILSAVRGANLNEVRLLVEKVMQQVSQFRLTGKGLPSEKLSRHRRLPDNTQQDLLHRLDYSHS